MAPPRRPSKATSPSPAPLSFPGVALGLFAAIAAGFVASRALKKRSSPQLPAPSTHLSSTAPSVFPALLRSLPNDDSSPSSSFRLSNDDPAVEVVVREEIAPESQDEGKSETIEEQSPVAKVRASVAVEKDSTSGPECSLQVNESNIAAVEYNLEVETPGQIDEDGVVQLSVRNIPEGIEPQQGINVAAEARVEAIPVDEGRKESKEVDKRVVEATVELTSSVDVNNASIQAEEGRKEQSSSEQSSVFVNGKTLESNSEVDSEEDHDELSNGSSLSDGTSCSVDSESSLKEVTSAAVKPLDPCPEEGEADKVGAHRAEGRPLELDTSTKDCSAHGKESNEQLTAGDKTQTIGAHFFDQSTKKLLLKVDFMLNSDENGGVALISPKFEVSIGLQSNKQSIPIAVESARVQEGVDSVTLNGVVISQPSDSKGKSFQSDPEISAEGSAFNEFRETPRSTVATPIDENEGTMAAENKQDSTLNIIDVEAEMEPLEESTDARPVMKTESKGESFNPGENLNGKQGLEKENILQSEEELDRCSSSEDSEVRLYTESSAQNEESRPEELDTTDGSTESSNNIDTEPEHLSSNSSLEQKVSPKEQRQSDYQDGFSETLEMKTSEQEEKQQAESAVRDQIFESEKLIEKPNLSETFQRSRGLSGDQIHASITGKQSLLSAETPTAKLLKGMRIKFAGHIPVEMALICVLIGLLSTVLWFLRSTSVRDITGVTAHN